MRRRVGAKIRATAVLDQATGLSARAEMLDRLWIALAAAELPAPKAAETTEEGPPSPPPPEPAKAVLRADKLVALGQLADSGALDVDVDPSGGKSVRLLFAAPGSPPRLCTLSDGSKGPWTEVACRNLGWPLPDHAISWRLARTEPKAPELIYVRFSRGGDGFFDASSGQRLWRPWFADAQATIRNTGETNILYAVARSSRRRADKLLTEGSGKIDHMRLVRFEPGKAPSNRRLRMPPTARSLLAGRVLMWWTPGESGDDLQVRTLLSPGPDLSPAIRIGALPKNSRYVDSCASGALRAVLFAPGHAKAPHTLVLARPDGFAPPMALGAVDGPISLHCSEQAVGLVVQRPDQTLTEWRCTEGGCRQTSSVALPELAAAQGTVAVGAVGERLLALWSPPGKGLRMRLGRVAAIDREPDAVLLDPAELGKLQPVRLRLISRERVALLLLRSRDQSIYALRIDSSGAVQPLRPSR